MEIRGILFDIGDTLLAATALQREALQETAHVLEAERWIADPAPFIRAYETADRSERFDEIPDLNHLYSDERIIAHAFQLLRWPDDSQFSARFLKVYRSVVRASIKSDPELKALLGRLREQRIRLGIVSNGTTFEQLDQLARLGIKEYFDPILISEEVGVRKPHPRIFLRAADHWNLPPRDILVVGDRADWDVVGARCAGMKSALTIQFVENRDASIPNAEPDLVISNLSELLHCK